MKLGIVGHESAKFTAETEQKARDTMRTVVAFLQPTAIVSGHCHLGGVDIWAEELAAQLSIDLIVHTPKRLSWAAPDGFKDRNLAIARDSDLVLCVVVQELPPDYKGMRFKDCYHCKGRNPTHVKSGGCWTAWKCPRHEWAII